MTRTTDAPTLIDLRARLGEHLTLASDEGWQESRLAWNRITNQVPAIVARPGSVEDVAAVLAYARGERLQVAVQGTGHGANALLGNLEGKLLLQMSRLNSVEIDPVTREARVGAGAIWDEVAVAAAPFGLAGLAGSSPNVGVVGFALGGGIGWLARRHGLAANSVRAIQAVLTDGRVVTATAEDEPDLFWALRGGGGSFAVVTEVVIQLYPVEMPYAGFLMWPVERAAEVMHAWLKWTRGVSEDVTTSARIMQFPPLPMIPEPMRGRAFVNIDGAIVADEATAREILQPLRDLEPELDTFAAVPAPALGRIHLDPEDPVPAVADGLMLDGFDEAALDAFLAATPPAQQIALIMMELRHLGGAASRPEPGQGVAGTLGGDYSVFALGMGLSPEMAAGSRQAVAALLSALAPWKAARRYMNFSDSASSAELFFPPADAARLLKLRERYDPRGMLLSSRPLGR